MINTTLPSANSSKYNIMCCQCVFGCSNVYKLSFSSNTLVAKDIACFECSNIIYQIKF